MTIRSGLCIGAHPDDETRLAGGTLILLAERGVRVHILCATRGEGGELGEPPVCKRERIAKTREQELRCAAEAMGAASVDFLDYIDPLVGEDDALFAFEADYAALIRQIQNAIQRRQADVVLTHGSDGEYGHPAHVLLHKAVCEAVETIAGKKPLLYSWCAQIPGFDERILNKSDTAHLMLDVHPWFDKLEAATECHRSQRALFVRRKQAQSIREILIPNESFHRHLPLVEHGTPDDDFAVLMREAGASTPEDTGA
jgi:LmbE family N-acetylglucosaminyl deacetylase